MKCSRDDLSSRTQQMKTGADALYALRGDSDCFSESGVSDKFILLSESRVNVTVNAGENDK